MEHLHAANSVLAPHFVRFCILREFETFQFIDGMRRVPHRVVIEPTADVIKPSGTVIRTHNRRSVPTDVFGIPRRRLPVGPGSCRKETIAENKMSDAAADFIIYSACRATSRQ